MKNGYGVIRDMVGIQPPFLCLYNRIERPLRDSEKPWFPVKKNKPPARQTLG